MHKITLATGAISIILLTGIPLSAQSSGDTLLPGSRGEKVWKGEQILPVTLITTGALLNIGSVKEDLQARMPLWPTKLDDYFQYAPVLQMYAADIFVVDHLNRPFDQTKYFLISTFTSGMIVGTLKEVTSVTRPDGTPRSWPSGHTTQAFVSATLLYKEFHDSRPVLAASGYVFAVATGIMRMTNNRHWLPDVVAGAGLGILVVNLVYLIEPLKDWQPFSNLHCGTITPYATTGRIGIMVTW